MAAIRRLKKELFEIADTKENDKTIALMPLNPQHLSSLRGIIIAPPGSPIEGYIHFLEISIPPEYPYMPPKIRFENRVWHPKVRYPDDEFEKSDICLDAITPEIWEPKTSFEIILLSIQSLLAGVGEEMDKLEKVVNGKAAEQYLNNRASYDEKALECAREYGEGYGLRTFYDYRMLAAQQVLKLNVQSDQGTLLQNYKMHAFCCKSSPVTYTLCFTIVPNLYMYRQCIEEFSQNYTKITSLCFSLNQNKISISYEGDGFTRDKCWKILPLDEMLFSKDDIDRDHRKHKPITCKLKLEWVRTTHDPERFLHQFSVIDAENLKPIRSFDICIDPQLGGTEIATIRNKKHDERPTMPELIKFQCTPGSKLLDITEAIGERYTRFGIFLLEDDTGSKVQAIKHQLRGESCSNISMEILRRWLEGEGKQPTTWATLIDVLYDCQLVKCADDIKNGITGTNTANKVRIPQSQDYSDRPWYTQCCSIM